jgi:hypothetical protein
MSPADGSASGSPLWVLVSLMTACHAKKLCIDWTSASLSPRESAG